MLAGSLKRLPVYDGFPAAASRSLPAHSSQQTSTVWSPIFTSMTVASSASSQTAQVFWLMISTPFTRLSGR
eukprot:gene8824-10840_t